MVDDLLSLEDQGLEYSRQPTLVAVDADCESFPLSFVLVKAETRSGYT